MYVQECYLTNRDGEKEFRLKTKKRKAMYRNGKQTDKCNLEGTEWRSFTNAEYQKDKRNG